jgi:hypothetical protein
MLRNLSDPPSDVNEGNFALEKTIENDKEAFDLIVGKTSGTSINHNYSAGNRKQTFRRHCGTNQVTGCRAAA